MFFRTDPKRERSKDLPEHHGCRGVVEDEMPPSACQHAPPGSEEAPDQVFGRVQDN